MNINHSIHDLRPESSINPSASQEQSEPALENKKIKSTQWYSGSPAPVAQEEEGISTYLGKTLSQATAAHEGIRAQVDNE